LVREEAIATGRMIEVRAALRRQAGACLPSRTGERVAALSGSPRDVDQQGAGRALWVLGLVRTAPAVAQLMDR
jgi:hypothetical protein